jgi:arylsulfatase A-like enzyme
MGQKSVVLVTVDCLRADHVGFAKYPRPTTPFLDSLAGESFVFPAAIVAGMPTYYSLPAVLASRPPLALGRDVIGIGPGEPTLATELQTAGYKTAAFVAANPYISMQFGYEQGFGKFDDFLGNSILSGNAIDNIPPQEHKNWINSKLQRATASFAPLGALYNELYFRYCQRVSPVAESVEALRPFPTADVIIDKACEWLAGIGEAPFFLWLHLMDPHSPYYPKGEAAALMGDQELSPYKARYRNSYWNRSDIGSRRLLRYRDEVLRLYDAGIRWVDLHLGRLVEALRSSRRWDRCVFALTADHGEEFLDHGGRYHAPAHLWEELIHVPLLVRVPEFPKKWLSNKPFSFLNLAPTLLDMAGQPVPADFYGKSFWSEIQEGKTGEGPAISECVSGCTNPLRLEGRLGPRVLSVREEQFKLILHFDNGQESLYDLGSDRGEEKPLPPEAQKAVRRRLMEAAREHLRCSSEWSADTQMRMRARLREFRIKAHPPNESQVWR